MTTSMIKGNPLKLMLQFAFPLLLRSEERRVGKECRL